MMYMLSKYGCKHRRCTIAKSMKISVTWPKMRHFRNFHLPRFSVLPVHCLCYVLRSSFIQKKSRCARQKHIPELKSLNPTQKIRGCLVNDKLATPSREIRTIAHIRVLFTLSRNVFVWAMDCCFPRQGLVSYIRFTWQTGEITEYWFSDKKKPKKIKILPRRGVKLGLHQLLSRLAARCCSEIVKLQNGRVRKWAPRRDKSLDRVA